MSKTHPNPGKLKKGLSISIDNQESAYRTLLSVPFLSKVDRLKLMNALVEGPELSWIRLAFSKGLLPGHTAAGRESSERFLAGSGAENVMLILRSKQRSHIRLRGIKRLSENRKNAYIALKGDGLNLTGQEIELLLDAVLPMLTATNASPILERVRRNEVSPAYRARVIAGLNKGEAIHVWWDARFLLQADGQGEMNPPLTKEERAALIAVLPSDGDWHCELLLRTLEKSTHDDCKFTKDEQLLLVSSTVEHLCKGRHHNNYRKKVEVEVLLEHKDIFNKEQVGRLQKTLEALKSEAA